MRALAFRPLRKLLLACGVFSAAAMASTLSGQQATRLELKVTDEKRVEVLHAGPLLVQVPIRCDSRGNLYFQGYDPNNLSAAPVVRIAADGARVTQIDLRRAPGFERGAVHDFAVSPRGEVYFLAARKRGENEVVRFSGDGEHRGEFRVEPGLRPYRIAVFASGEVLLSGVLEPETEGEKAGSPLLALYDGAGRFLREFTLARDTLGDSESQDGVVRPSTRAAFGDDGNVYVMRQTDPPVVFAINSLGVVVRRVVVRPPGTGYRPLSVWSAGTRLLVEFDAVTEEQSGPRRVFSLWDSHSGDPIAEYVMPSPGGGILASFTSTGVTLLSTRPGSGLHLLRARM